MKVWIVEGWFGDHEWIEAVCLTEERAGEICDERWVSRRSIVLSDDDYRQGVCKFMAVEHEVVE